MFKKLLSVSISLLLIHCLCAQPVQAANNSEKQVKFIQKIRDGLAKLGTGQDARVAVKLRDKTKIAGYISEIKQDSFSIADVGTGLSTEVALSNVTQVKGHNLSTGAKVAIGLGIVAAVLLILLIFENYG
jgi:hypothetical protein